MSILEVDNLAHSFGDKVLFKNISFRLLKGEHAGLVGRNGSGKTTLFNLLTGKLLPDEGKVKWHQTYKIGYLDQYTELIKGKSIKETLRSSFDALYALEKEMIDIGDKLVWVKEDYSPKLIKRIGEIQDILNIGNFYSIDSQIESIASGLGLKILGMDTPIDKLSGGQRTKVALAKLLLFKPEILLLDEPTNYLDKEHVEWLSLFLKNYENSFIVISHDTVFLNSITNVIYNLEFCNLTRYPGNYDSFLKLQEKDNLRYFEEYNRQQREIEKLEKFINANIVRASTTKRAQSRQKKLDKIDRMEKPRIVSKPNFYFKENRESGKEVLKCSRLDIGYHYPILRNLELKVERGDKIALTGANGIGKSTLMKTIVGSIPAIGGVIEKGDFLYPVYFEQELRKDNALTAMEEVWSEFPRLTQKEIRQALARCGLKEEHILMKMSNLSGGEQAKVRLCKLMMTPSNWLLLDEPTNHLDNDAKASLKESLKHFSGTIILVSHEKEFYQDWINCEWNLESICNFNA